MTTPSHRPSPFPAPPHTHISRYLISSHLRLSASTQIYKNFDPRAGCIRKVAEEVFQLVGRDPLIDVAVALEKAARADDYFINKKLYPNVDFYSGLVYRAMGARVGALCLVLPVAGCGMVSVRGLPVGANAAFNAHHRASATAPVSGLPLMPTFRPSVSAVHTGFPTDFFTVLFAIPRVTGYLAHWRESLEDIDMKIARPQQAR